MRTKQQTTTARPQGRCSHICITQLGILEVAIQLDVRWGYASEISTKNKKIYKHSSAKRSYVKQPRESTLST